MKMNTKEYAVRVALEAIKDLGITDPTEKAELLAMVEAFKEAIEEGKMLLGIIVGEKGNDIYLYSVLRDLNLKEIESIPFKETLEKISRKFEKGEPFNPSNTVEYLIMLLGTYILLKEGEANISKKEGIPLSSLKGRGIGAILVFPWGISYANISTDKDAVEYTLKAISDILDGVSEVLLARIFDLLQKWIARKAKEN